MSGNELLYLGLIPHMPIGSADIHIVHDVHKDGHESLRKDGYMRSIICENNAPDGVKGSIMRYTSSGVGFCVVTLMENGNTGYFCIPGKGSNDAIKEACRSYFVKNVGPFQNAATMLIGSCLGGAIGDALK